MPQSLGDLEPRVRALLQKRLARGRVELAISVQLRTATCPTVELNADFASALAAAIEQARERGLVAATLTPGDLLRLPQAITVRERPVDGSRAGGPAGGQRRGGRRAGACRPRRDADPRRRPSPRRPRWAARICSPGVIEQLAGGGRTGRLASRRGCTSASAKSSGAAGRSGDDRAGNRPRRGTVGHQRGSDPVPGPPGALGWPWRRPTSRAAESSISCCRR